MTIEKATKQATEKAVLYHAAKRKQDQLYHAHSAANAAAKTATDLWMSSATETSRAEDEWVRAKTELSNIILRQADAAFTC